MPFPPGHGPCVIDGDIGHRVCLVRTVEGSQNYLFSVDLVKFSSQDQPVLYRVIEKEISGSGGFHGQLFPKGALGPEGLNNKDQQNCRQAIEQ